MPDVAVPLAATTLPPSAPTFCPACLAAGTAPILNRSVEIRVAAAHSHPEKSATSDKRHRQSRNFLAPQSMRADVRMESIRCKQIRLERLRETLDADAGQITFKSIGRKL